MARDLLFRSLDALLVEVVNEELIAPSTATAGLGICGIGRVPVFSETLYENLLDAFWPDLSAAAVLEELSVFALGGNAGGC